MTWLSRLLPQSPSLRLADRNNRTRQGQRRRRMATLETLEGRTLLSAVNLVGPNAAGLLTLNFDKFSDNVTITETGNKMVKIQGSNNTVINPPAGQGFPNNTVFLSGVTSIQVNITGAAATSQNSPVINLQEILPTPTGQTRITNFTVVEGGVLGNGPNLTLNVGGAGLGVANPGGTLAVWGPGSTIASPNPVFGTLNVTVTNSQFQTLAVDQQGCCQAYVDLENDTIPGNVFVSEGVYAGNYKNPGDQILVDQSTPKGVFSTFGATTLEQGQGPAVTPTSKCNSCNGAYDVIQVDDAYFQSLTISQKLQTTVDANGNPITEGGHQLIEVGQQSDVQLNYQYAGLNATQGNGDRDTILICNITSFGPMASSSWLKGPDSIVTTQGSGKNDQTTIANSFVWGNITATQADVADLTGKDNGDCIIIANSTAVLGNIEATQGDGNYDFAAFYGDTTGYTNVIGTPNYPGIHLPVSKIPVLLEGGGLMQIIQGNGYSDTATLDCGQSLACCPLPTVGSDTPGFMIPNDANNVNIQQGAYPFTAQCDEQVGDTINVNCTIVIDNMTLVQGFGDTTDSGFGANTINVGTEASFGRLQAFLLGTYSVYVGESTIIDEIGSENGGNYINLGGGNSPDNANPPLVPPDFVTGTLDVYTGDAGGSQVTVYNTLVLSGALSPNSLPSPFTSPPFSADGNNIAGGDGGIGDLNTLIIDVFSSQSVTFDSASFYV